jgi:hypothetical protein
MTASALECLRCVRASVADAASELELTDRHDAALLAQHCDRIEQDLRAIESTLTASAAVAPMRSPRSPDRRDGGTSLDATGDARPTRTR